jgi:hypothetical protein
MKKQLLPAVHIWASSGGSEGRAYALVHGPVDTCMEWILMLGKARRSHDRRSADACRVMQHVPRDAGPHPVAMRSASPFLIAAQHAL